MGIPTLKEAVDFLRNPDFFGGKLAVSGKDVFFTPGDGAIQIPAQIMSALNFWAGLQISFNYAMNVGDTASVYPFGQIHFIDPSGLKGKRVQDAYFLYLDQNHPKKVSRAKYDQPGKGIPDIITTNGRNKVQLFYEIKPNNAAGKADGKDKLQRINATLDRFFPPGFYQPGPADHLKPLSLKCQDQSCGAGNFEVFLEQTLEQPGLILYRFRLRFEIDPGPFITKAVIAIAIVALLEGGAAALEGAAAEAGGTAAVADIAEHQAIQKVRVELLKRVAEETGSSAVEYIKELEGGSAATKAVKAALGK